ncbi:outer membrane beta-barrel protein [Sphingomonas oryzagri]
MRRLRSTAAFVLPLIFAATGADAQDGSSFARDRNVGVVDRSHPELDPLGIRIGTFTATPSVTTFLTYDDNIYAQDTGRRDDLIATVQPALAVTSDWSSHAIGFDASLTRNQYLSVSTQSTTDYALGANGRLDIARGSLAVTASTDRLTQARTAIDAPDASRKPIQYHDSALGFVAMREFGRFRLLASLDWHRFRYRDATALTGLPLNQTYRDRDTTTGEGRIEYALTPAVSVYVDATANRRSYRDALSAATRDSHGYTLEAGSDFDITHLVRGHLQFGYLSQSARDKAWSAKGFSGRGKVEWFTTPVLTVTVEGGRSIQDSALSESAAYSSTDVSVRADYELLRSIILSAKGGIANDHFEGIDQHARQIIIGADAKYRMGRRAVIDLSFQRVAQRTPRDSLLRRFTDDRATLSFRLQI